MGRLHIKGMDSFNDMANLLDMNIESQLNALNATYNGKVTFIIDNAARPWDKEEPVICILWASDDVNGLELPNCKYIDYRKLFTYGYKGNISLLKIPKNENNSTLKLNELDSMCYMLNALVIEEGTEIIDDTDGVTWSKPAMLIVERHSGNNKVFKLR